MPIFSSRDASRLDHATHILRQRMVATTYDQRFTEQDYLDLFVHPVMHETARAANDYFNMSDADRFFYVQVGDLRAWCFIPDKHHLPAPKKPELFTRRPELVERLTALVHRLRTIHVEFDTVDKVLVTFAGLRLSHSAAAFCLPGLKTLAAMLDDADTLVKGLNARPSRVPSLDLKTREMCGIAARAIATAQLVPEDINQTWDTYFAVRV